MEKGYIAKTGNYVVLSETGFRFYGAIVALFWSDSQKAEFLKTNKKNELLNTDIYVPYILRREYDSCLLVWNYNTGGWSSIYNCHQSEGYQE